LRKKNYVRRRVGVRRETKNKAKTSKRRTRWGGGNKRSRKTLGQRVALEDS